MRYIKTFEDLKNTEISIKELMDDCLTYDIDFFDLLKEMILNNIITFQCYRIYDEDDNYIYTAKNITGRCKDIKLVDEYSGLGDPDSTYRTRLRFNTLDFPIQFIYRSRTVKERWKIHAGLGLAPVLNFKTNRVFNSVEDGFHLEQNQTSIYFKKDIDIQNKGISYLRNRVVDAVLSLTYI